MQRGQAVIIGEGQAGRSLPATAYIEITDIPIGHESPFYDNSLHFLIIILLIVRNVNSSEFVVTSPLSMARDCASDSRSVSTKWMKI